MKKIILTIIIIMVVTAGTVFAINKNKTEKENIMEKKVLVAYFSASGVTKGKATLLSQAIDADLYEIQPKIKYTNADLDWTNPNSRSSVEMRDKSSRPEIADKNAKIENYDVIFLGFPIWWYVAPTIINIFLESYDFSGKTIILFATSGGSGFGETIKYLKDSVSPTTKIIQGKLLNGQYTKDALKEWAENI